MTDSILLCTDGSDASTRAITEGLAVVREGAVTILAVVDAADPMLVTGTGFAGGTLTEEEYAQHEQEVQDNGSAIVDAAKTSLGLDSAATAVLRGEPGQAICQYAEEQGASVIVVGTRGNGGLKRA